MATGRKDYWLSALVTRSTYDVDVDVPPNQYIHGWDAAEEEWVKLICTDEGQLIIDPTGIFENPPIEDNDKKAASSEWAYDHWKDAAAHHAKFTDANARSAINNILDSVGKVTHLFDFAFNEIIHLQSVFIDDISEGEYRVYIYYDKSNDTVFFQAQTWEGTFEDTYLQVYFDGSFKIVATEDVVDSKILTHKGQTAAHHAKYTDLQAQTACNLNGNLYWSCPGNAFTGINPHVDDILKSYLGFVEVNVDGINLVIGVKLPNGCVVLNVNVYGNASAEAESWTLARITLSDGARVNLSSDYINTENTIISYATIDNILHAYYFFTTSLDTGDVIYGARIIYTL